MESTTVPRPASPARVLVPLLIGAAVALGLGIYGKDHQPTEHGIFHLVFTDTINLKTWFATAAGVLAVFQVLTALSIYRVVRFPRTVPQWLPIVHRVTGILILILIVPVAYQCLWGLGFQDYSTRVLVHSIAGCFFCGAFAAKVVVVEMRGLPRLALPIAGGILFSALVVLWYTSALWFFGQFGFPSF